mmetsp:Transcript_41856/g.98089  ORF Transcript_41856/g.98089 Transcript_41856/m.98089 type:complete len:98 (+) Transcript_41856:1553-1846(+)
MKIGQDPYMDGFAPRRTEEYVDARPFSIRSGDTFLPVKNIVKRNVSGKAPGGAQVDANFRSRSVTKGTPRCRRRQVDEAMGSFHIVARSLMVDVGKC